MSKTVGWSYLQRLMAFSFEELEKYIETVDSALNRERKDLESFVQKELAGLDEDEVDEKAELYSEDFEQLATTFPNIARRSAFLTIYATFESWLLTLCWRVQKMKQQDFGPQDLKGEFSGAKAYLKRLAGIELQKYAQWQEIDTLRKIRNILVHPGGNVRRGDRAFRELLTRMDGASLDGEEVVVLTDAFCRRSIETVRTCLGAVARDLENAFQ